MNLIGKEIERLYFWKENILIIALILQIFRSKSNLEVSQSLKTGANASVVF